MLHEKIYSKVRVGLPLTYSWGAVRLHKVTQTNENGYTKLHKGAVVTQNTEISIRMKFNNFRALKRLERGILKIESELTLTY